MDVPKMMVQFWSSTMSSVNKLILICGGRSKRCSARHLWPRLGWGQEDHGWELYRARYRFCPGTGNGWSVSPTVRRPHCDDLWRMPAKTRTRIRLFERGLRPWDE